MSNSNMVCSYVATARQLQVNLKDFKLDECNLNKNKNRFFENFIKKKWQMLVGVLNSTFM